MIKLVDTPELRNTLKLISPVKPVGTLIRVGNQNKDGGYVMVKEAINGNIVYSLGIGTKESGIRFDREMADLGHSIFMYDHTINNLPYSHTSFHWKKLGISTSVSDRMTTLSQEIHDNNHLKEDNIILQCDIEDSEWSVIQDIDISVLKKFSQILIEFHNVDTYLNSKYELVKEVFTKLRKHHVPFHIHGNNNKGGTQLGNNFIPNVIELSYVRKDLIEYVEDDRTYPTELDRPNRLGRKDLKLGDWKW